MKQSKKLGPSFEGPDRKSLLLLAIVKSISHTSSNYKSFEQQLELDRSARMSRSIDAVLQHESTMSISRNDASIFLEVAIYQLLSCYHCSSSLQLVYNCI